MKTCPRCHLSKPESEFYPDKRRASGLTPKCKDCERARRKEHYSRITPEQRERLNEIARNRYHGIYARSHSPTSISVQDIRAIKSKRGCLRCGENDHYALDFHHVSEKTLQIGAGRGMKKSVIESEISKCIVLCSNCHRKLHAGVWSLPDLAERIKSEYPDAYLLLEK